jgi:DNA invertase Pin-like site-specific DNA recombinase
MGKMVLTVLGMVAEMELSFLKERQRAGIEAAKAKGVYKGRPPTFDHAKIVALRKQGREPPKSPGPWGASAATSIRRSRLQGSTRRLAAISGLGGAPAQFERRRQIEEERKAVLARLMRSPRKAQA